MNWCTLRRDCNSSVKKLRYKVSELAETRSQDENNIRNILNLLVPQLSNPPVGKKSLGMYVWEKI